LKSYNQFRTLRIPHLNKAGNFEHGDVDLAIQRQASSAATMIWQMLNPDFKVEPFGDPAGGIAVAINELRSWPSFANANTRGRDTIDGLTYATVSIESFHNGIHNLLGTGARGGGDPLAIKRPEDTGFAGHMGDTSYAAVSLIG